MIPRRPAITSARPGSSRAAAREGRPNWLNISSLVAEGAYQQSAGVRDPAASPEAAADGMLPRSLSRRASCPKTVRPMVPPAGTYTQLLTLPPLGNALTPIEIAHIIVVTCNPPCPPRRIGGPVLGRKCLSRPVGLMRAPGRSGDGKMKKLVCAASRLTGPRRAGPWTCEKESAFRSQT